MRALGGPVDALAEAVTWNEHQTLFASAGYVNHVWASAGIPSSTRAAAPSTSPSGTPAHPTIAEHWSCGGKDFPDDAGTVIRLTGVHEGVYRVEGIVRMLDQDAATTDDLPRGYDLLYQTCQNSQSSTMSITALTRLG